MAFTNKYQLQGKLILKKSFFTAIVIFCSMLLVSCKRESVSAFEKDGSQLQLNQTTETSNVYEPVSFVVWTVGENSTIEARLEVLSKTSKDYSASLSPSRLVIKNRNSDKIIFEQNSADTPVSMYVRPLNEDIGEALIVTWSGGSADRIEIFDVGETSVRKVLSESFRIDASLADLSGVGQIDVLITTGDNGSGPFYTTRYVWDGTSYKPTSKVLYKDFVNFIQKSFKPSR
jgi:hypothetical protein